MTVSPTARLIGGVIGEDFCYCSGDGNYYSGAHQRACCCCCCRCCSSARCVLAGRRPPLCAPHTSH